MIWFKDRSSITLSSQIITDRLKSNKLLKVFGKLISSQKMFIMATVAFFFEQERDQQLKQDAKVQEIEDKYEKWKVFEGQKHQVGFVNLFSLTNSSCLIVEVVSKTFFCFLARDGCTQKLFDARTSRAAGTERFSHTGLLIL